MNDSPINVADRLADAASRAPEQTAVVRAMRGRYSTCTFHELDDDATALARGLIDRGITPGARIVLLVKPGVEFVKLVFALLRCGATTVLVDPGMGRKHLVNCLAAARPEGFVAVSAAQAVRTVLRRRFPRAAVNVTVGRRWFWGGATYKSLLDAGRTSGAALPTTAARDAAAIIFTSGSTGPPKGVLYTHEMFDAQVHEIQRAYDVQPGGVDLACFALFGLFNSAMGVTTVFPEMDFSRPATAEPRKLLAAANDWRVTQAFASPAVWDRLSRHGAQTGARIPTLREIFSCGAPVPAEVLQRTLAIAAPQARMHTPYGATEALPVATIEAREVLEETAARTRDGAGVCVGRKFDSLEWRVIGICDDPIETLADAEVLGEGEIGELVVRGKQVSPAYMQTPVGTGRLSDQSAAREGVQVAGANASAKITDGDAVWHRMGDVGYLDDAGRFWYCGRKSQRVVTDGGTLFTECCEAIVNVHPAVRRSALVPHRGAAAIVVELEPSAGVASWEQVREELRGLAADHETTRSIRAFFRRDSLPTDVRHNAKIQREALSAWVAEVSLLRD